MNEANPITSTNTKCTQTTFSQRLGAWCVIFIPSIFTCSNSHLIKLKIVYTSFMDGFFSYLYSPTSYITFIASCKSKKIIWNLGGGGFHFKHTTKCQWKSFKRELRIENKRGKEIEGRVIVIPFPYLNGLKFKNRE